MKAPSWPVAAEREVKRLRELNKELAEERDRLLAACKKAKDWLVNLSGRYDSWTRPAGLDEVYAELVALLYPHLLHAAAPQNTKHKES